MKRFYKDVTILAEGGRHAVVLDGRPVRTPARAPLSATTPALADAIADEWRAQAGEIDPRSMRLTRLAETAIDTTGRARIGAVAAICGYGPTDMTCYRAERPSDLVACQEATWRPLLEWLDEAHDVRLTVTAGIVPVRQPPPALEALKRAVDRGDEFVLTGLYAATVATGSVVVSLALRDGRIDAATAWQSAQVDETYQNAFWGEDAEAAARRAAIEADLGAAARMMALGKHD